MMDRVALSSLCIAVLFARESFSILTDEATEQRRLTTHSRLPRQTPVHGIQGQNGLRRKQTKTRNHINQCAKMMEHHLPADISLKSVKRVPGDSPAAGARPNGGVPKRGAGSAGRVNGGVGFKRGAERTNARRTVAVEAEADGADVHGSIGESAFAENLSSTNSGASSAPIATCVDGLAKTINGDYKCSNVDLLSFVGMMEINSAYGDDLDNANDNWGWTDLASGREFAIMGTFQGTAFVEITNPTNPVYKGVLPSFNNEGEGTSSSWGDMKTYRNYLYKVSEKVNSGLQVFDLTTLLVDSVPGVQYQETSHYVGFGNAHNIIINEETGYAYIAGSDQCGGALVVIDLENPFSLKQFPCGAIEDQGYTHDAHCVVYKGSDISVQGKELCFACNEVKVVVFDMTDKLNPKLLSTLTYSGTHYTHQGWLTDDHEFFIFGDEMDELKDGVMSTSYVVDLRGGVKNPKLEVAHRGSTRAIDHNQYIIGAYSFQANYRAGFQLLHLKDLNAGILEQVGHFDIHIHRHDYARFNGAWSVYPFFPSGNIVLSGIEQGLFVLRPQLPFNEPEFTGDEGVTTWVKVSDDSFTNGSWGVWSNGGNAANVQHVDQYGEGTIRLKNSSSMRTSALSVAGYRKMKVDFSFFGRDMGMDDTFELLGSGLNPDNTGWTPIEKWTRGKEFRGHQGYSIEAEFDLYDTGNAWLQFKLDGTTNSDSISFYKIAIYGSVW